MREPQHARFVQLVRQGAAARDIHDSDGSGAYDADAHGIAVTERFLARELGRVDLHLRSLCAPLAPILRGARSILDVGCGTGGTSVALALAATDAEVVGVDACRAVLQAAAVRAEGHAVQGRVAFKHVEAGKPLPFADASFALVTCVSVLEFVGSRTGRRALLAEMLRVLTPGGSLYLATPSPWHLRELHSGRWLGDWRRRPGFPWSSSQAELRRMLTGCEVDSLARERLRRHRLLRHVAWAAPMIGWALPWQRLLVRKPPRAAG